MSSDARKLATHADIFKAIHALEQERRAAMAERMREYDEKYYRPNRQDIQEACAKLGHVWRFTHFGPLGDPWYSCNQCHASECRPETEQ